VRELDIAWAMISRGGRSISSDLIDLRWIITSAMRELGKIERAEQAMARFGFHAALLGVQLHRAGDFRARGAQHVHVLIDAHAEEFEAVVHDPLHGGDDRREKPHHPLHRQRHERAMLSAAVMARFSGPTSPKISSSGVSTPVVIERAPGRAVEAAENAGG
jgi:hypothetical protein